VQVANASSRLATVDQGDVAGALAGLIAQGPRGRANELVLTPSGRPPAPW
jgi:hypothetical protein